MSCVAALLALSLSGCLPAPHVDNRPQLRPATERPVTSRGRLHRPISVRPPATRPTPRVKVDCEGAPERFDVLFIGATRRHLPAGIPPEWLAAQACEESHWRRHAVSEVGAKGVPQFLDSTARDVGVRDAFDPEQAIPGMARYMAWAYKQWRGHKPERDHLSPRVRYELGMIAYHSGMLNALNGQVQCGGAVLPDGILPCMGPRARLYVERWRKRLGFS